MTSSALSLASLMWVSVALLAVTAVRPLLEAHGSLIAAKLDVWVDGFLSVLAYRKAYLGAVYARECDKEGTNILSLLGVDIGHVKGLVRHLPSLILLPISAVSYLALLVWLTGYAALFGILALVALLPLEACVVGAIGQSYGELMGRRDVRTKYVDEMLKGIKTVKVSTLEPALAERIMSVRNAELALLQRNSFLGGVLFVSGMIKGAMVLVAVCLAYTLLPGRMTCREPEAQLGVGMEHCALLPDTMATVTVVTFMLTSTLGALPHIIGELVKAKVSYQRLMQHLLSEDTPGYTRDSQATLDAPPRGLAVRMRGASFGFGSGREDEAGGAAEASSGWERVVVDLGDLEVREGERVAVIGLNGSGKSALLFSLLQEFHLAGGSYERSRGKWSLLPQNAVLLRGTIRDNVLFGQPYDAARYDETVDACALRADLDRLPLGDQTQVGGDGKCVSGGQRQRIALARACYASADVVLLDDPTSALDRITKRAIVRGLFGGAPFRGRTLIACLSDVPTALDAFERIVVMHTDRASRTLRWTAKAVSVIPVWAPDVAKLAGDGLAEGRALGPYEKLLVESAFSGSSMPWETSAVDYGIIYVDTSDASDASDVSSSSSHRGTAPSATATATATTAAAASSAASVEGTGEAASDGSSSRRDSSEASTPTPPPHSRIVFDGTPAALQEAALAQPQIAAVLAGLTPAHGDDSSGGSGSGSREGGGGGDGGGGNGGGAGDGRDGGAEVATEGASPSPVKKKSLLGSWFGPRPEAGQDAHEDGIPSAAAGGDVVIDGGGSGGADGGFFPPLDDPDEAAAAGDDLEHRSTGGVTGEMWRLYVVAAGGWWVASLLLVVLLLIVMIPFGINLWTAHFSAVQLEEVDRYKLAGVAQATPAQAKQLDGALAYDVVGYAVGVGVFTGAAVLFGVSSIALATFASLRVSRAAFGTLLSSTLRATQAMHDCVPSGRFLSRFSADIAKLDDELMNTLHAGLTSCIAAVVVVAIQAVVLKWFALLSLPVVLALGYFAGQYRALSRASARLQAALYSRISEDVNQTVATRVPQRAIDWRHQSVADLEGIPSADSPFVRGIADLLRVGWNADLGRIWFSLLGSSLMSVLFFIVLVCANLIARQGLLGSDQYSPAFLALALAQVEILPTAVHAAIAALTHSEVCLVSLERIYEFARSLKKESVAPLAAAGLECAGMEEEEEEEEEDKDKDDEKGRRPPGGGGGRRGLPPPGWPERGAISFRDVTIAYRPDLPPALQGIHLDIAAGEKVGVIGRTGSGKTTLLLSLLRLVECEQSSPHAGGGGIAIDGVDVRDVPVHLLRSRIGVVMQDPVVFAGSLAENLRLGSASPLAIGDDELLAIAQRVGVIGATLGRAEAIALLHENSIRPRGEGMPASRRQKLCLARTLLRRCTIFAFDEATSSMDARTDARLQQLMREVCASATVLTIAHRLQTVMEADWLVVMGGGRIVETGRPGELAADPSSRLSSLLAS